MIKKTIILMLLIAFFSAPSWASTDQDLTILYTADVLGEMKPKNL